MAAMWGAKVDPFDVGSSKSFSSPEQAAFERRMSVSQCYRRPTLVPWDSPRATSYKKAKSDLICFITDNLKRKECVHFVPKIVANPQQLNEPIKCHCGELPERHIKGTRGIPEFFHRGVDVIANDLNTGEMSTEKWKAETDIRKLPTNAFGKIDFVNESLGGRKPSKYVRLADDTPIDDTIEVMMKHWHMTGANLVITVIGGAKNFNLDGKKKEVFNRGLVTAARTTRAWIITSGCNMGVMKAVGDAVQEGQSYNWDKAGMTHTLRCIGIAPWGYIEGRQALVSKDDHGCWNAKYKANNIIRHFHPVSLNPSHTHFLLVDDGYRGRYGGVADFRAKLERKISLPTTAPQGGDTGLGIPVVLVVVEGGTDAIVDASRSLKENIPVVLCEGTGRAADILAYAYTHFKTNRQGDRKMNDHHRVMLEEMLLMAYSKTWKERSDEKIEVEKYMDIVIECCAKEQLITVFDMNKHEELDLAILSALLKGKGATNAKQLHDQLSLAITWNRSDIAEEKIFTQNIMWPSGSLDDIMTTALFEDKVDFMRLLLQNGLVMKEYLTVPRLRKLYSSVPRQDHLHMLLQRHVRRSELTLHAVGKLIRQLIRKRDDAIYRGDRDDNAIMKDEDWYNKAVSDGTFVKPFHELFLWAVLMNRFELAKFLWERADDTIPTAIVASRIFRGLADELGQHDSDMKADYLQNSCKFERLAVCILDKCHKADPEKAAMMLERKYEAWGNSNCLEMAAAAQCKEFLSTVSCQSLLDDMWSQGITCHPVMVILAVLCPLLIFRFVTFEKVDADGAMVKLNRYQKFVTFYRAPVTKFASNVLAYMVFLAYYSYVILFAFRPTITVAEWIVIVWIGTLLVEEIREVFFVSNAESAWVRVLDWWHFSIFNKMDLFILVLAIIGFIMRFFPDHFYQSKVVYCINCVFLYIRVLRDFSASSYFGPKLVMIFRMMQELMLYIMIMLVFLLAYGISSQAIVYPVREPYWMIIRDIFYYPYWQIYGELFLDEVEGYNRECTGNITRTAEGKLCPHASSLVPLLTAGYLLIANVLLLNLLIAIFSNIFEDVQKNSIQIWKFGMYFLVVDYDTKPTLVPPFIFIEHIFLMVKFMCRKTCCKKSDEVPQLTPYQKEMQSVFEKEMVMKLLRENQLSPKVSSEKHIAKILSGVDKVSRHLDEDRLIQQNPTGSLRRSASIDSTMGFTETFGKKLYSRWPSLEQVKRLQQKELQAITETESEGKKMKKYSTNRKLTRDWQVTFSDSDNEPVRDQSDSDQQQTQQQYPVARDPNQARPKTAVSTRDVNESDEDGSDVSLMTERRHKRMQRGDSRQDMNRTVNTFEVHMRPDLPNARPVRKVAFAENDDDRSERQMAPTREQVAEKNELSVSSAESTVKLQDSVAALERRVEQMEENTQQSLHNIEVLLRNAVFYRGQSRSEGHVYQAQADPRM